MEIHFVSSLTTEDENNFAKALMDAVSALLDSLPIAYVVRIETGSHRVFEHSHAIPPIDAVVVPPVDDEDM
jgi:hypothetical protein